MTLKARQHLEVWIFWIALNCAKTTEQVKPFYKLGSRQSGLLCVKWSSGFQK